MTDCSSTDRCAPFSPQSAIVVTSPRVQTVPVVFTSPHSGRQYPPSFLDQSQLDPLTLRRSEDAFVDELFADVDQLGALLLTARFPRVYLDVNREAMELDPSMFHDQLPREANTKSPRVVAGIGTIARIVSGGREVYGKQLSFAEARQRIDTCYKPYHSRLREMVATTQEKFGVCLVVDCHSMPSISHGSKRFSVGQPRADVVIGDCWGSTCDSGIVRRVEHAILSMGYSARRNTPYAGGYTTRQYGQPGAGIYAIQLEIDRSLYMDERSITRLPVFEEVRARIFQLAAAITSQWSGELAAE